MIACHHNHVDLCRYLLSLHASINIQDSLGWTALMFSCREGHAELVDLLLEEEWDTDVDLTTSQGINALMCAADAGHTRIVRALMEKEADVNACTNVRKLKDNNNNARDMRKQPTRIHVSTHCARSRGLSVSAFLSGW